MFLKQLKNAIKITLRINAMEANRVFSPIATRVVPISTSLGYFKTIMPSALKSIIPQTSYGKLPNSKEVSIKH